MGQAIRDVYEGDERLRHQIYMWVRSKDFLTVCDFAFVHPHDMREQISALMELSPNLAKKYGRLLREKIISES